MHWNGLKLGLWRRVGAGAALMAMVAAGAALAGCPADKPASGPGDVLGADGGGTGDDDAAATAPSGSATVEGTAQADAGP
jgi:hypothetical protein